MVLRDSQGDVDVGIGDFWCAVTGPQSSAKLEVVCPDDIHRPGSTIWCRIVEGTLEFKGEKLGPGIVLRCKPDTVAGGVRNYRASARHAGVVVSDTSE